ncbi:MAG TPA: DUF1330 domain-containing protein [Hyphomonadaceae bacterium]|nr:DUF1330 domain-containing protein [Hyphomonadaceae bacterium]
MPSRPKELNEELVRSLPDTGTVTMVNLLRFRERSADGNGSGWDAYTRYSKGISHLLKGVGGRIIWTGKVDGPAYGDPSGKHWEFIALVRYPSRAKFLEMVTSSDYAVANDHRENGVEDHLILASTETYSKFPPV